ncbi:MAG: TonB-dependent receptor, partial [Phenylobacterium sp.]|nr:TonB-dependent receptor [Phenylobacterium sp.]
MSLKSVLLAGAVIGLASLPPVLAVADEADQVELEAIVVTAQKREQSLLDVPMSLSAFDGETLDRIGANTLEDVSLFTPGFEVREQSVGAPGFVIRG